MVVLDEEILARVMDTEPKEGLFGQKLVHSRYDYCCRDFQWRKTDDDDDDDGGGGDCDYCFDYYCFQT